MERVKVKFSVGADDLEDAKYLINKPNVKGVYCKVLKEVKLTDKEYESFKNDFSLTQEWLIDKCPRLDEDGDIIVIKIISQSNEVVYVEVTEDGLPELVGIGNK